MIQSKFLHRDVQVVLAWSQMMLPACKCGILQRHGDISRVSAWCGSRLVVRLLTLPCWSLSWFWVCGHGASQQKSLLPVRPLINDLPGILNVCLQRILRNSPSLDFIRWHFRPSLSLKTSQTVESASAWLWKVCSSWFSVTIPAGQEALGAVLKNSKIQLKWR